MHSTDDNKLKLFPELRRAGQPQPQTLARIAFGRALRRRAADDYGHEGRAPFATGEAQQCVIVAQRASAAHPTRCGAVGDAPLPAYRARAYAVGVAGGAGWAGPVAAAGARRGAGVVAVAARPVRAQPLRRGVLREAVAPLTERHAHAGGVDGDPS